MPAGVLPIFQCGDPILRRQADPLDPATVRSRTVQLLIRRMQATMEAAPGVGLAAPRGGEPVPPPVNEARPGPLTAATPDDLADRERTEVPFTVLVNPVLVPSAAGGIVAFHEGCLSVPGLTGVVARHRAVRV